MNVTLEKINDGIDKLIVKVEENDYKDKVKKELNEVGLKHSVPGFRKGHVPYPVLVRMFGRQVKSDVINNEVYNAVVDYITNEKLPILGEPLPVNVKEITMEGKDYTFEYEIGLAPEFSVELDKSVEIPYYAIEVSKEMEEQQDNSMRERFGTQGPSETFEPRALVKGVLMQLDEEGKIYTGEDAIQVTAGIVAPFLFKSKEEAAKFEGTKVGDKVVFNPWNSCEGNVAELSSMLNVDKERAGEVKSDFELAISEIIVNRPAELGQTYYDELFGKDKVTNEEEYRKNIKAMVAAQLAPNSEGLFKTEAEKVLVDKFGNFDLPEAFLKKWLMARNENLNEKNIDAEYEAMVPGLKWQLIKEKVAALAGFKIEEADLKGYAKSIAAQQLAQYGMYNLDDQTLEGYAARILSDKNSRNRIIEAVGDAKLFNAIKNLATIDVKEVSVDAFKEEARKYNAIVE